MKIRLDFVTNSSSSSFIIGKKGKSGKTVENTFQVLKGLYKEYIDKFEIAKQYISEHPDCGLTIKTEDKGHFEYITYADWNKGWHALQQVTKNCKKDLKFDPWGWSLDDEKREIIKFKTYAAYQQYWMDKVTHIKDEYIDAPFTICSLRDPHGIQTISNDGDWYEKDGEYYTTREARYHMQDLSLDSFLIEWYKDEFKTPIDYDKIKEPCFDLLGQVCIYSESGNIPEYVVDKLRKISEFSCNHMG